MTQNGCYCCPKSTGMDIDSALDELGMLSSITDSRKQYLSERSRTRSESSVKDLSRFRIVHIDPLYVTGFSSSSSQLPIQKPVNLDLNFTEKLTLNTQSNESPEFKTGYRNPEEEATIMRNMKSRMTRMSRLRASRYKRFLRPYEVPWRINQSLPETEMRQADQEYLQSKSNATSPVKSETSLTRSRSLGNLDLAKLSLNEFLGEKLNPAEKEEMEKVSDHLENLHVTDKT